MEKIILKDVIKYYGDRKILDIEELKIYSGEKIGVVGINGSGKSTLLNIIFGKTEINNGKVIVNGNMSYIEQLKSNDSYLSGGEVVKKQIEENLNNKYDIVLADEPSSNLDIEEKEKLKNKLKEYKGTLILISHDRNLLDEVVDSILEVENGSVTKYKGNYSKYKKEKEEKEKRKEIEYVKYLEEKNRLEVSINRVKNEAKAMKKTPKRMGNSEARLHKRGVENKREKVEKSSKSLETRLGKLEEKEKPNEKYHIFMKMPETLKLKAKFVVSSDNLNIKIGNKELLNNVKFNIKTNSKTALIGKNGTRKNYINNKYIRRKFRYKYKP